MSRRLSLSKTPQSTHSPRRCGAISKIEELKREIQKLDRTELASLREWFQEYDSDEWDRQIEEDARTGKLDKLADEALAEYRDGKTKVL